jgi:ATP-binding protein involved in chromosome partitioning
MTLRRYAVRRLQRSVIASYDASSSSVSLKIRTYHELTEADRSGLPDQIAAQRRRVASRLAAVGRVLAVLSGKGGVGKSFVTAGLARSLARAGRATGVLDADFNGPTAPQLLRLPVTRCASHAEGEGGGIEPVESPDGVRCFSMGLLLEDGHPLAFRGPEAESHVWRGTLEAAALREFLADVAWGTLDILLVDLPPGVQRFQELTELLTAPPAVLAVTIPTPESRDAVRRALRAAIERGASVLGVIENMVGGSFSGNAGDELAAEFAIPLLARVPFHPTDDVWTGIVGTLGSSR